MSERFEFLELEPEDQAKLTRLADRLEGMQSALISVTVDLTKWMLAGLLTINAGALVAVAQVDGHAAEMLEAAGGSFIWGIVAAISSGLGLGYVYSFISTTMSKVEMLYRAPPVDFEKRHLALNRRIKIAPYLSAIPTLIGVGSLALFCVGAQKAGDAMANDGPSFGIQNTERSECPPTAAAAKRLSD